MGIQKNKKSKAKRGNQHSKATQKKPHSSTPDTSVNPDAGLVLDTCDASSTSSLSKVYCVPNCIYAGQAAGLDMLRCCLCMNWIHPVCCDEPVKHDKEYIGVYTCTKCRTISDKVISIEAKLDSLFDLNKSLINMLTESRTENMELRNLVSSLKLELTNKSSVACESNNTASDPAKGKKAMNLKPNQWSISPTKEQNNPLTQLNPLTPEFIPGNMIKITPETNHVSPRSSLENSDLKDVSPSVPERVTQPKEATTISRKPQLTIIGNSMVRDSGPIIANQLQKMKTSVLSISGYTIDSASSEVSQNIQDFNEHDTVVFQLGTVEMQDGDPFVAAAKYSELIGNLRSASPRCNVVIASVPYRLYSKSVNERIDQLNSTLRLMCVRDPKCMFWDVNPSATKSNYRSDGLHFSHHGINQFARLLAQKIKQINFSVQGLNSQV